MDPAINYDDLKNLYAQANLPPKAKKVKPGEHLDIFPNRLRRHCAPPLRISELRGLFPPMHILGWYYTMTEFGKRFGQDRPLDVFETRILDPYYEKLKDVADVPAPLLSSDYVNKFCIVYVASNSNGASMEASRVSLIVDGLGGILGEVTEPQWIRMPVRP
ncbi:hypothetical protein EV122DRAFT_252010 [Schizophyllum commune]